MSNYGWIPSSTVQQRSYPPASTTTQSTSSIGPAAVITIALASFILLIIGVLHIRCIIRRRSDEAVARNTPPKITRLESTRIAALPTFAYDSTQGASSTQCCSVCLSVVKEGEMVRVLPSCNHVFHINCIDTWLRTRSTCPVCRADVKNVGKSERDPTATAAPPV